MTQLVYMVNELAVNKEGGFVTDVLILDFAKAFDSVNHRKLLFKLEKVGIHPTYIALLLMAWHPRLALFYLESHRGRCWALCCLSFI